MSIVPMIILSIILMFILTYLISSELMPINYFNKYQQIYGTLATGTSNNFVIYSNPVHNIQIQYPIDWYKMDGHQVDLLGYNNNTSIPVVFFNAPDLSVSFSINVEELSGNITIGEYVNAYVNDSHLIASYDNITSTGIPLRTVLYNTTIDPNEYMKEFGYDQIIGVAFELKPINTTAMVSFTVKNNKVYSLLYSDIAGKEFDQIINQIPEEMRNVFSGLVPGQINSEDKFLTYLPIAQKMISSFEIIDDSSQLITNDSQSTDEEPLKILDSRLAKGEITVQEYQELKKILDQQ